ncbi:MAG: hypothetical protein K9N29_07205 [Candidatus Marinimicrobia bacterium]|nr:hypothetical protein [Candidatus Neomarinimicrobiota bacterium]
MLRYIIISISSGLLFGVMDALINANSLARKLYQVYQPLAKTSINPVAGLAIDLLYGFILAGLFLMLFKSLPGDSGLLKGISFGLMVWFLRVVMYVASQWMMYEVPGSLLIYMLATGLLEMLILGLLFGLTLKIG